MSRTTRGAMIEGQLFLPAELVRAAAKEALIHASEHWPPSIQLFEAELERMLALDSREEPTREKRLLLRAHSLLSFLLRREEPPIEEVVEIMPSLLYLGGDIAERHVPHEQKPLAFDREVKAALESGERDWAAFRQHVRTLERLRPELLHANWVGQDEGQAGIEGEDLRAFEAAMAWLSSTANSLGRGA